AGSALAACGTANASSGPVTLNFYFYPDSSAATATGVKNCSEQSHGKYTISYQQLPEASDGQRQQLVRRLAAHDNTMDILGLEVTWEAEVAQDRFIEAWTGAPSRAGDRVAGGGVAAGRPLARAGARSRSRGGRGGADASPNPSAVK